MDVPTALAVIATGAMISALLVPPIKRFATRHGVVDHTVSGKAGARSTPLLGGVAIVVAYAFASGAATIIEPGGLPVGEIILLIGLGLAVSMLGVLDDLRSLPILARVAVESLAALGLWVGDVRLDLAGQAATDLVLTIIWVVVITNSINLLDNIDGLSAGIAVAAAGWSYVLVDPGVAPVPAALAAALAGAAAGFLVHNRHPATIYMGDGGSLFIGFMLAYMGIELSGAEHGTRAVLVPVLVLGVALFDTGLVVTSRLRAGRSPFMGGRDHASHRLIGLGLSTRAAVRALVSAGVVFGAVALGVRHGGPLAIAILLVITGIALSAAAVVLMRVPVYEEGAHR